MKHTPLHRETEIRLIQKLNELEISLYKIKNSLIQWGISLVVILTGAEAFIYKLFH